MSRIFLGDVCVDFPVYNARSRGLINTLFGYARMDRARIESVGMFGSCVHALRNIDLELVPGDRIGLIGRNGAGKTTLLRVLSGAYEPTSGIMEVSGNSSALTDIMLGMDVEASGYENIVLRSIAMGKTKRCALAIVPDIEEFTELGPYLDLPVRAYSTGMMLRLAFAISTAYVPDILIMDEMIGAGDASFLHKAKARIAKMMNDVSIVAIASHSEEIVRSYCNKAVILEEGRVAVRGNVDECLGAYKQRLAGGA